jgi:hypothetical protein
MPAAKSAVLSPQVSSAQQQACPKDGPDDRASTNAPGTLKDSVSGSLSSAYAEIFHSLLKVISLPIG